MNIATQLSNYGEVREHEEMKLHTTFRIGGKVRYAFYPTTVEGIRQGVMLAQAQGMPYKVVGKGSNLLWSDDDLDMMVIFLDRHLNQWTMEGTNLICDAGCSLIAMAVHASKLGLSGLEFASGIPGSVGGAVFMNAGAYHASISDVITKILVYKEGEFVWLDKDQLQFSYRHSCLKEHPDWIVVQVVFACSKGNPEDIKALMDARRLRRLESQPLDMPSAGSTFKNPHQAPAWKCIEDANLRGAMVGGAQVSMKHCNFIVNVGNATANDVLSLAQMIQETVYAANAIELVMEVEQYQCQRKKKS